MGPTNQDQSGTAQGLWYNPAQPARPEAPHLALVHDNVDPALAVFSVGASVPNLAPGVYSFAPEMSGKHNRDFKDITVDGSEYCFDSFPTLSRGVLGVKLIAATTIQIEAQGLPSCATGPGILGSGGLPFQR